MKQTNRNLSESKMIDCKDSINLTLSPIESSFSMRKRERKAMGKIENFFPKDISSISKSECSFKLTLHSQRSSSERKSKVKNKLIEAEVDDCEQIISTIFSSQQQSNNEQKREEPTLKNREIVIRHTTNNYFLHPDGSVVHTQTLEPTLASNDELVDQESTVQAMEGA